MIGDLKPLHDAAKRDQAIVAHFAHKGVRSIQEFFLFFDASNPEHVNRHFADVTGLPTSLELIYFLDLVREAGTIDALCGRLGDAKDGALPRRYVAVMKRYFAEQRL